MQEEILTQEKDYVQTLLSKLETTGTISTITDNGDGTYICVCSKTKNLTEYDHLDFSGHDNWVGTYQIKNVTSTGFDIIRETGITGTIGIEYIKKIHFFYGTPTDDIKQIISEEQQNVIIANLVVLYMPTAADYKRDKPYLSSTPLWMCFMKSYPNENLGGDWTNDEHFLYAINPMTYLANKFMLLVDFKQNFTLFKHIKYGKLNKFTGYYSELLDQVSGVELTKAILKIPKKHTICNFN